MQENFERPNYYAVIPADVRYSKDITANAKLLYAEVTSLCNKTGTCWASNKYFAELYGVQPNRISVWVKQLVEFGFLECKVVNGTTGSRRYLRLRGGVTEKHTPPYAKAEDSNTKINKNNNGELEKSKTSLLSLVNEITGRSFRTLPERGVKKTLDAFTLEEISSALRALVADPWHAQRLKEFKIDYLIRATTIDKFMGKAAPTANGKSAPIRDENGDMVLSQEEISRRLQEEDNAS